MNYVNSTRRKNYTLLELVAVIMLLLLVAGVAVMQFRKHPAFISLDRQANELKRLCSEARNSACCQGKKTVILLKLPERRLSVRFDSTDDISSQKFSGFALLPDTGLMIMGEKIDMKQEQTIELFKFFPDGTGMAQCLCIELGKHQIELRVSPLTGCISSRELKQNQ